MTPLLPLLAVAALALGLPAAALHCPQGVPPEGPLGIVALGPAEANSTTYYLVDRDAAFGDGVWVYEESNGVDRLQSGGCSGFGDCDHWYGASRCPHDDYVPDRLVF